MQSGRGATQSPRSEGPFAGTTRSTDIAAELILVSGCQDNQLSSDGDVNGLFTETLLRVWGNGSFSGDYRAFHSAIVRRMPMDQVPNFYTVGTVSASFQAQRPFTLTAPAASVPANPGGWGQGTGSTGSPRRTLRHGDSGEDVRYLQQRLSAFGYWLSADGQFGPATESTVRSFQRSQGWWPTASWVRRPGPPSADPRSLRRPSREAAAPSIPAP